MIDPKTLWFDTVDAHTLCRMGANGPKHPSQLYAVRGYVRQGENFLDYGSGSATTLEAIRKELPDLKLNYLGVDIVPKFTEWCQKHFPDSKFEVNPSLHKIDQPDRSWDVVYSRHVVDHMESFEGAMEEHLRVAKRLVIVVLWVPFNNGDEHQIKHIIDQGKVYKDEYTNCYSKKKVMEYLDNKKTEGWNLLMFAEDVGAEVRGHDTVIVLERRHAE